jgi:NADH-quinone oxidoreductase subunit I
MKRFYRGIIALAKGLGITLGEFFSKKSTQQYPEVKRRPYAAYRGIHYFRPGADGAERCVACGLCAAVCPNQCIYIESADSEDKVKHPDRQYAERYSIVLERCLFCGYCEEACPKQAIALSRRYDMVVEKRSEMVYTKDKLLAEGLTVDENAPGGVLERASDR